MDGGLRQGDTTSVNSWPLDYHSIKNVKKLLAFCSSKTRKAETAQTKVDMGQKNEVLFIDQTIL